jgi:osmoprotectant transport system ATP-binding protein
MTASSRDWPSEQAHRLGASVEFRHVTREYGRAGRGGREATVVVDDLSLVVPSGEVCVVVGPSGCGKTTTLKMVNRLIEPTSGQILIDGDDVATVDVIQLRRRIGYVIQHVGLFPHQTVADNIATIPRLLGWKRDRIGERVDELLTLIGLDPAQVRHRYPHQLSGGERQRVGVARALAVEPPLLLMDEPFGAVDPIVRQHLQDEFLQLQRRLGTTILLVTHDVDEAIKLGDRLAVMQRGGRLVQYASPAEILANPVDDFVARFVGADRVLKLLGLLTIARVHLDKVPAVSSNRLANETLDYSFPERFRQVVLVDEENRPRGWLDLDRGGRDSTATEPGADPCPPRLDFETSLRDALPTLLASPRGVGVVVDSQGRYIGVVTLEAVRQALRSATSSLPVETFVDVPVADGRSAQRVGT